MTDGSLHAATPSELVGEALTTWCVSQDGSDRIVHPLGGWRLEQAAEHGRLILTLKTPDGFSIAFTLTLDELAAMAEAGEKHLQNSLAPRGLN